MITRGPAYRADRRNAARRARELRLWRKRERVKTSAFGLRDEQGRKITRPHGVVVAGDYRVYTYVVGAA
jgi:hypothetical protein